MNVTDALPAAITAALEIFILFYFNGGRGGSSDKYWGRELVTLQSVYALSLRAPPPRAGGGNNNMLVGTSH